MSLRFYYWPRSSATRVYWALEELGVPYEKVRLDRTKGDHKKPDFLAINPNGKIPAMTDDGVSVFESLALLVHLGERFGVKKGLWPEPGTPAAGEALSWAIWGTVELNAPRYEYGRHTVESVFALPPELKSPALAERAKATYYDRLGVLDKRLAGREYLLGKGFTLVDVSMATLVSSAQAAFGLPIGDHPNVAAWVARCIERPACKRVMSET